MIVDIYIIYRHHSNYFIDPNILCNIQKFYFQVSNILKDGGRFISVTFSQPHFRKPFLAKTEYNWSISLHTFGNSFHFFFYVMKKGKELNEEDKALERATKNKANCINKSEEINGEISEDEEDFLLNMTL